VPLAGIAAAAVGVLFGLPSFRLKMLYLAMSTLAAQFIIVAFFNHAFPDYFHAISGIRVNRPELAGIDFTTNEAFYYVVIVITVLMTFFAKNIVRCRLGRAFVAIRDNDLAAEVMGISLFRYKLSAFFIGCFFPGIGGALWAHYTRSITPEYYLIHYGLWYLGYIIVGGMGATVGPFFGAGFLIILTELLAFVISALSGVFHGIENYLSAAREVLFGLVVILFMILEPRGIAHRWQIFKAYYRLFPYAH